MTMVERSPNTPAIHRHVENPIGIGKSTTHDAHDGDDDELQRFSKWGATLCGDRAMGREHGITSATKPVAVAVPLGL
jgi:hypothetical protein